MPLELLNVVQSADVAVFESDFTSATEHKELRECVEKRYQCLGLDRELEQRLEKGEKIEILMGYKWKLKKIANLKNNNNSKVEPIGTLGNGTFVA